MTNRLKDIISVAPSPTAERIDLKSLSLQVYGGEENASMYFDENIFLEGMLLEKKVQPIKQNLRGKFFKKMTKYVEQPTFKNEIYVHLAFGPILHITNKIQLYEPQTAKGKRIKNKILNIYDLCEQAMTDAFSRNSIILSNTLHNCEQDETRDINFYDLASQYEAMILAHPHKLKR
jgi:hypothetical protein